MAYPKVFMTRTAPPSLRSPWRERLAAWTPILILAPSLCASLIYVFGFTLWTFWISVSSSTLMPQYDFVGLKAYVDLWSHQRWKIAYANLLTYSAVYVLAAMALGLALAIAIDQRIRAESGWRTIFLYPLAVSFVVTGTVWSWLYSPDAGIEFLVRRLGWTDFDFRLTTHRETALYAIIATGIWHSSGFAMALFLAGLRSIDADILKAAAIDGASPARTYRRVILPQIVPIFVAVAVVLLQFAIKTFDLAVALTGGGPGISTTFPAMFVYDFMFQRGQIAIGAAGAVTILAALAVVLVPYGVWSAWRTRREAAR
jgi:glucose/mannose transport system permease protein